jgi:hypothetical protein
MKYIHMLPNHFFFFFSMKYIIPEFSTYLGDLKQIIQKEKFILVHTQKMLFYLSFFCSTKRFLPELSENLS